MFVKVCGITRVADALHAIRHGATAVGFVFWPSSPRAVTPEQAAAIVSQLPRTVTTVGVFVNEAPARICEIVAETGITAVQLHGDEPSSYAYTLGWPILRAVSLATAPGIGAAWPLDTTLLLDAADPVRRGGTGIKVDWKRAAAIAANRRIVLAGGLTQDNVAEAVAEVRPFGVDVSSGVESSPGIKDFDKIERFLANARQALAQRR